MLYFYLTDVGKRLPPSIERQSKVKVLPRKEIVWQQIWTKLQNFLSRGLGISVDRLGTFSHFECNFIRNHWQAAKIKINANRCWTLPAKVVALGAGSKLIQVYVATIKYCISTNPQRCKVFKEKYLVNFRMIIKTHYFCCLIKAKKKKKGGYNLPR